MNETIVLGGGCFWCVEASLKAVPEIVALKAGYVDGIEVVQVEYLSGQLETVLLHYFAAHDPTSLDKQGADTGLLYRSVIFYVTEDQLDLTTQVIKLLNDSDFYAKNILTEVRPLQKFVPAEEYHQNYYVKNPTAPYCQVVIEPKLMTHEERFKQLQKVIHE